MDQEICKLLDALRSAIANVVDASGYGQIVIEVKAGQVRDIHVLTQYRGEQIDRLGCRNGDFPVVSGPAAIAR
jgi:hypothetical protein